MPKPSFLRDNTASVSPQPMILVFETVYYDTAVQNVGEYPHGVMVKAMDCGIVVSEFELQSRYYVHFRANTLGKGMNPLILQLWVK